MKTKYTFLENRLLFQNPERPQMTTAGPEEKVDNLENQINEIKALADKISTATENEAYEIYEKLLGLSDEIKKLQDTWENQDLATRIDDLGSYVDGLLNDLYLIGKDELGLNLRMIDDLATSAFAGKEYPSTEKFYPSEKWVNDFSALNYANRKRVMDKVISELDNMTAGTLIIEDAEEDFWRGFAAEHAKQKNNPEYDWRKFIDKLAKVERKVNVKSEKADDVWLDRFNAMNDVNKEKTIAGLKDKSDYWKGFYYGYNGGDLPASETVKNKDAFDEGYGEGKDVFIG